MWERLKECWIDALAVFLAVFYLGHLVAILLVGSVRIYESNPVVLVVEIVLLVLLAALGVERLVKDLR